MLKINSLYRLFNPGIIALLCVTFVLTASCDKGEKTSQKSSSTAVTGPIIDMNIEKGGVMDRLDIDAKSPEDLALMGDKYFESGNYIQAIALYRKVLALNPKDVDTYNDLGLSLHYTNQSNEAVDILRQGAQLNPNYQNIWLSLGFVLTQTGRNDEAKIALQHTQKINPASPQGQEAAKLLEYLR